MPDADPEFFLAGNTVVPAYLAVRRKGYSVRVERKEDVELWYAEAEGRRFVGFDPMELLALVGIYETFGRDWPASDRDIDEFFRLFDVDKSDSD